MATSDDYVCTMNTASAEKALKELNEDPKNRLGAVETFRTWILQQKHLKCPTDTAYLLKYLRAAKFSQLRARQILENYLKWKTDNPHWLDDLDAAKPEVVYALQQGFIYPLPGYDKEGRKVLINREGNIPVADLADKVKRKAIFNATFAAIWHVLMDENVQVNGVIYLIDMTGQTMKHMTAWGMSEVKESMKFQDGFPARFKGMHYYNTGAIMETIFDMIKPLMKQKLKDRIHVHGNTLEEVYEFIPMSSLPDEYLPDDYTGPRCGQLKDVLKNFIIEMQEPEMRKRMLYESSSEWKLDKKQKDSDAPSESFRKLNVD